MHDEREHLGADHGGTADARRSAPDGAGGRRHLVVARATEHRCIVLSAPPGYGKTATAEAIAAGTDGPVLWCRLTDADVGDGGASRLLHALVEAYPHLGRQPPVADSTGAARLAYALAEVVGPATIVVEDLDLLEGADDLPRALLDGPGDGVRVVVTTQDDPPAVLVRGIADGRATLVGPSELLLDLADCDLAARAVGSTLTGAEILARSGGWALAAAALARSGSSVEGALARDTLGELGPGARETLGTMALLSSVPPAVVADLPARTELVRFAQRHPALIDVDDDRWQVRELLRSHLLAAPPDSDAVLALADRLDRAGNVDAALILLSRLDGPRAELQDRLRSGGTGLLDSGRYALVRTLVAQVPVRSRWLSTLVLDAAAALAWDQVEQPAGTGFRIDDAGLRALVERPDADADDQLALAGLRTDFLRRRGDPHLVEVALEALVPVGPVGDDTDPAALVAGRSVMARRGLFQVLHGLGAAACFSGDPDMVAEGRRLLELAFSVAERAGIDTVPLRAQSAFDQVTIGLEQPSTAVAPLEAGIAALRAVGHPEAANQLVQLADIHNRLGDTATAATAIEAARDWAERTGNELVRPSLDLVRAGTLLIGDGPSPALDLDLQRALEALAAGPRLRRTAPSIAVRIANVMLDHDDPERAAVWLARARALVGGQVQRGYQEQFIRSVTDRLRFLTGADADHADDAVAGTSRFDAQPAGVLESRATTAWDHLRRGDPEPARRLLADPDIRLDPPWPARLGAEPAEDEAGPALRVLLLCPELRIERHGHPVSAPTGHAARLLAQLVINDGVMTVEAALDDLWPSADPAAARNRFHQVLLRLRRSLGVATDGTLTITDGVIRLDSTRLTSDVWDLRGLHGPDRAGALRVIRGYESDLGAAQFAYDDAFDQARWELSRRLADLVTATVADGVRGPDADDATDDLVLGTVWDAWSRLADDHRIGLALADALDRRGRSTEAGEIRNRISARALL